MLTTPIEIDETPPGHLGIYIKIALESTKYWNERRKQLDQPGSLSDFLSHVAQTVPYYQEYFREFNKSPRHLSQFPAVMRADFDKDPYRFRSEKLIEQSEPYFTFTNGTIGKSLKVHFDLASWYDFNYETYSAVAHNIPGLISKMIPNEIGVFFVTNLLYEVRSSYLIPTLRFARLRRLIIERNKDEDRETVLYLRKVPVRLLYGKPLNLLTLAEIDESTPDKSQRIRPDVILTSGENLYEDDRQKLENWYRCPVYNAYISTEGGLIALECKYHNGLHIQHNRAILEVIGSSGEINRIGSGQLLLTNFVNWAHPFVRYELSDYGTIIEHTCPCGHKGLTISNILGGEVEIFRTPFGQIQTGLFGNILNKLAIKQYQVTQIGPFYFRIRWIPISSDIQAILQTNHELLIGLSKKLEAMRIEVIPVQTITPRGGKLRRFVKGI